MTYTILAIASICSAVLIAMALAMCLAASKPAPRPTDPERAKARRDWEEQRKRLLVGRTALTRVLARRHDLGLDDAETDGLRAMLE